MDESIVYVVQEIEHDYGRYGNSFFPHPPRVFTDVEAAREYVHERCLSYSEECWDAYESLEGGLEDPVEATFQITPAEIDSKDIVTTINGLSVH